MPKDRRCSSIGALLVALMTIADAAQSAAATGWEAAPHSRVRLVAAGSIDAAELVRRVQMPGPLVMAGVEIELDEGWKTYWRSPGDGIAPEFDWSQSANVAEIKVLWPVPQHFSDIAGTYNGYEARVLLPVVIVPKKADTAIALNLTLDYAVCKDVCIPVTQQLSTQLGRGAGEDRSAVRAALRQTPMRADAAGRCDHLGFESVSARLAGDAPRVEIIVEHPRDAAPQDVFAEASTGQFLPHPEHFRADHGRTVFHMDLSATFDPSALYGETLTLTATGPSESCEMAWTVK